ncbi:hypothetical protein [Enterococcus sp. AZ163]|uniref:hypothetical protein n=1 Tax=Enterococcus sp. AZ163 TaxID=2774638 RepID=UPI003D2AE093
MITIDFEARFSIGKSTHFVEAVENLFGSSIFLTFDIKRREMTDGTVINIAFNPTQETAFP